MTMTETRLSPDELKTLFLFESLEPEQLTWLSERGTVETRTTNQPIYREGEEATCFFVLLSTPFLSSSPSTFLLTTLAVSSASCPTPLVSLLSTLPPPSSLLPTRPPHPHLFLRPPV